MFNDNYVNYLKDVKITRKDYDDDILKLTRNIENIEKINEINDILLELTGKPNSSKTKIGLLTKIFGNKIFNKLTLLGFEKVEFCDNIVFDNEINEKYIKEFVKLADYNEYIMVCFDVKQIRGIKYHWDDEKVKRLKCLFSSLKYEITNQLYNSPPLYLLH